MPDLNKISYWSPKIHHEKFYRSKSFDCWSSENSDWPMKFHLKQTNSISRTQGDLRETGGGLARQSNKPWTSPGSVTREKSPFNKSLIESTPHLRWEWSPRKRHNGSGSRGNDTRETGDWPGPNRLCLALSDGTEPTLAKEIDPKKTNPKLPVGQTRPILGDRSD